MQFNLGGFEGMYYHAFGPNRDGTNVGIYRGRAWPRFWLARVEVAG
jgi:hypothetical protein